MKTQTIAALFFYAFMMGTSPAAMQLNIDMTVECLPNCQTLFLDNIGDQLSISVLFSEEMIGDNYLTPDAMQIHSGGSSYDWHPDDGFLSMQLDDDHLFLDLLVHEHSEPISFSIFQDFSGLPEEPWYSQPGDTFCEILFFGTLTLSVDSLTITPVVPEPTGIALFLAGCGIFFDRRRRSISP